MLKTFPALLLFLCCIGTASAEDVSLVIHENFTEEIQFGGIFNLFRKNQDVKRFWLDLQPRSGTVTIQSVTLDRGNCTYNSLALPVAVTFGQKLEVQPNCDVTEAEIGTDGGTYRFSFDKAAN